MDFSRRRGFLAGLSTTAFAAGGARAQTALAPSAAATQAAKLDDRVGPGFTRIVIAMWGDGVLPDAPPFNPYAPTAEQADTQFPYEAVIAGLLAPPAAEDGVPRLVMVLANPDVPAGMVFPDGVDHPAIAGRLQGATVLNLQYQSGRWVTVDGGYQSRRITDGTLCQISGPAAAAIGTSVQGLIAPQTGCVTPWGSALFGEGDAAPWLARLAGTDLGYADPAVAPRFGWVTELNPLDPGSFPVKRTALGRFARAGVAAALTADGRPVIFMSQDDAAGMLFRFIAASNATDGTALDTGTLAVAQITADGISWADLGGDVPSLVGAVGAGRNAGGSAFDAPGGIAIAPDGGIYLACRGNAGRGAGATDLLNPRAGDPNGHVIALHAPNGDLTSKHFTGEIAIAAGNPMTVAGTQYTAGSGVWLTNPRTLNVDAVGQLWIGTDQQGQVSASADGLFIMQTGGPSKYLLDLAYLAPLGAAIGGAAFAPQSRTVFGMVRHPGATPGASFGNPATRWPSLRPGMPPQSTVIGLVSV